MQGIFNTCKVNGVSLQHFYDIKKACGEQRTKGLREKSRKKPCLKSRVAADIEEAALKMTYESPAPGQARAADPVENMAIVKITRCSGHELANFRKTVGSTERNTKAHKLRGQKQRVDADHDQRFKSHKTPTGGDKHL